MSLPAPTLVHERTAHREIQDHLTDILAHRRLTALFQPIVDMRAGEILGYEGLIRGPSDSPLHSPIQLFKAAQVHGLSVQVEHLCRRVVIEEFVAQSLTSKLFLNVSPESLVQRDSRRGETLHTLRELGLASERVVIELTENEPSYDYELVRQAIAHYRSMGFRIAIDDLGEGFSSLRRWSELRPEFVKIDMHFIQGIDRDPVKRQFVHSIHEIARSAGTRVIAEGIETEGELLALRRLGLQLGQGYFFARPTRAPLAALAPAVTAALTTPEAPHNELRLHRHTAGSLARSVLHVEPSSQFDSVYTLFVERPELAALPVVDNGVPVGLLLRNQVLTRMASLYGPELHGRKPCRLFMDPDPLIVEARVPIQALAQQVAAAAPRHLVDGFILTEEGRFLGYGTGHDLMRAVMAFQIESARLANPLTGLPGNLPINDHIDQWLAQRECFVACYFDLDAFKPYNDLFGYARGDDVIAELARILVRHTAAPLDFVGHIGGDDFIALMRSDDWERRCRAVLDTFAAAVPRFFTAEVLRRGEYEAENREGQPVRVPLLSLSIGCVKVRPGGYASHASLAAAAAAAKCQAKKQRGNSLYVID